MGSRLSPPSTIPAETWGAAIKTLKRRFTVSLVAAYSTTAVRFSFSAFFLFLFIFLIFRLAVGVRLIVLEEAFYFFLFAAVTAQVEVAGICFWCPSYGASGWVRLGVERFPRSLCCCPGDRCAVRRESRGHLARKTREGWGEGGIGEKALVE